MRGTPRLPTEYEGLRLGIPEGRGVGMELGAGDGRVDNDGTNVGIADNVGDDVGEEAFIVGKTLGEGVLRDPGS